MRSSPRIRAPRPEDASRIAELASQLGYPSSEIELRERLKTIDGDDTHWAAVAAEEDDEVIGWIHTAMLFHLESGKFAEIVGLVVDERSRGDGIGKLLVQAAEAWARRIGCTTMTVRSNVLRKETHKFYERLGYPVVKEQKVYRKKL